MTTLLVSRARADEVLVRFAAEGQRVLSAAHSVSTKEDYDEWGLVRSRWRKLTVTALASVYGQGTDEVREFQKTGEHLVYVAAGWEHDFEGDFRDDERGINVLESLRERLEFANEPSDGGVPALAVAAIAEVDPVIFLVHGSDHGTRAIVARFLEKAGEHDVVILDERASKGRTLIEKFEEHASEANYAVVLLTPDDVGRAATATDLKPRARQNVVFEFGFFCGSIGRERVAVLLSEGVEQPSDIDGLVYIRLDAAGAWQTTLAKELRAAGLDYDASRV